MVKKRMNVQQMQGAGSINKQIRMLELNNAMMENLRGLYHEFKEDGFTHGEISGMFGGMGAFAGGEEEEEEEEDKE